MIKTTKRGVYVTPDFEIEVFGVEAGFAVSDAYDAEQGTEKFGSYDTENL
jgi:hypothetical protein